MRLFLFLYFLFHSSILVAQVQPSVSKKDSLQKLIKTAKGDEKAQLFIQLTHEMASKNMDSSLIFLNRSSEVAISKEMKGKVEFEKAQFYKFLGKQTEEAQHLDRAIQNLKGINDTIVAKVLHNKHKLLEDQGRYKEALKTGHQVLNIFKKLLLKDEQLNAILQIGYTYDRMEDYKKAIEWYQKGLQITGVKNENYIGRNYGLIGIAYDELKDYEKAIFYNLKAIEHFKKQKKSKYIHTWYSNLGNTYNKIGKLDLAEKYTLLALEDQSKKRFVTIINLGKIYLRKGEFNKSEKILKNVLAELEKTDKPRFESEALEALHELYKKKGDYKTALEYFEKFNKNETERVSLEKAKQINELTVQYETTEKQNQIFAQQAKIKNAELQVKNRNFMIFGLLTLTFIIGLIGYFIYQKQKFKIEKQNKENALKLALYEIENQNKLQEQRLSISRDLHDNIGSQLTFIISSIDTTKQFLGNQEEKLNHRLSKINEFTRETISELRDTIWAMNNSEITIEDLYGRILNFINNAENASGKIKFTFQNKINDREIKLNSKTGMNVYRILQESVNNAIKHSDAKIIKTILSENNKEFILEIKDNGKGFKTDENFEGNGLVSMGKRAEDLGGNFSINSTETGTLVQLKIPKNEFQN